MQYGCEGNTQPSPQAYELLCREAHQTQGKADGSVSQKTLVSLSTSSREDRINRCSVTNWVLSDLPFWRALPLQHRFMSHDSNEQGRMVLSGVHFLKWLLSPQFCGRRVLQAAAIPTRFSRHICVYTCCYICTSQSITCYIYTHVYMCIFIR